MNMLLASCRKEFPGFLQVASAQVAAAALSFWPVWSWALQLLKTSDEDILGLISLLTFLALAWRRSQTVDMVSPPSASGESTERTLFTKADLFLTLALFGLYCLSLAFAPQVVSALLALTILGSCLHRAGKLSKPNAGDWALLLLAVPLLSSLNYYCGYPLRILAVNIAGLMLNFSGLAVSVEGTELVSASSVVGVDPACSGIKILWIDLYLAAALASYFRLSKGSSAKVLSASIIIAVFANAIRVSSLFYLESGIISVPQLFHSAVHSGIGAASFAASAGLLLFLGLQESHVSSGQLHLLKTRKQESAGAKFSAFATSVFFLACLLAALAPLLLQQACNNSAANRTAKIFGGWPHTFEGKPLKQLTLSEANERFARSFPGKIAVFSDGKRRIVFRWVSEASRQLHSAASCYQASGYQIRHLPPFLDEQGRKWESFRAEKGSEKLKVRERLYDQKGNSWPDASSWYWAAILKETSGPWNLISVAELCSNDASTDN